MATLDRWGWPSRSRSLDSSWSWCLRRGRVAEPTAPGPAALLAGVRTPRGKGATLMVRGLLLSVAAVGAIILELIIAAIAMPRIGTPVAGQPGSYTIHGPAGLVGGIVLALTILAIPLGIVLAVIGAIATASTRRSRLEELRGAVLARAALRRAGRFRIPRPHLAGGGLCGAPGGVRRDRGRAPGSSQAG